MNNEDPKAFGMGFLSGILLMMGFLILFQATPSHQLKKDQQEAVDHGYARWVRDTNSVEIPPTMKFEWIVNENSAASQ